MARISQNAPTFCAENNSYNIKQNNTENSTEKMFNFDNEGTPITEDSLFNVKNLDDKLQQICKTYNIDFQETKKLAELIKKTYLGENYNELSNIDKETANKIEEKFKEILSHCIDKINGKIQPQLINFYVIAENLEISSDELNSYKSITVNNIIQNQSKENNKNADLNNVEEKKRCLKEYFEKLNKEDPGKAKKECAALIANSSDEEKMLLMTVIFVLNDANLAKALIDSFSTEEMKQNFAENVSVDDLYNLNNRDITCIITEHLSKDNLFLNIDITDNKFHEYYEQHKEDIIELYELKKQGKEIPDNRPELKTVEEELKKFESLRIGLTAGTSINNNLNKTEKEDAIGQIYRIGNVNQDIQNDYLKSLASYINDSENNLNISTDIIKDILDNATEGKFAKILDEIIQDKSAIDFKTDQFKIPTAEKIEEQKNYSNYLLEQTLNNSQKEQQSYVIIRKEDNNNYNKTNIPLLNTQSYNISMILDIVTGKKSDATKAEEDEAVESYKLLNTTIQGNLLRSASGKFFNKLLENTKTLTLKLLLATGWKGNSFAQTQKVKDTIEERKEKRA